MSANVSHDLRMVIQQIGMDPAYRISIYGNEQKPRHADFKDGRTLLAALETALPDFDTSGLFLDPIHSNQGSIVFTGGIKLTDRQLGLLGLI